MCMTTQEKNIVVRKIVANAALKLRERLCERLFERLCPKKHAKLALLVTLVLVGSAQAQNPVLFKDVQVFDGERVTPQTDAPVEDGMISGVGDMQAPQDAEIIGGRGKTLLPGLIDVHVHAFAEPTLEKALMFGVTTELDMFTDTRFAEQME